MMDTIIEGFGQAVVWIMMIFAVIGMICSLKNSEKGLGREWMVGLEQIGIISWSVCGFMTLLPYIEMLAQFVFTKYCGLFGVDPSVLASGFVSVDMGGYYLAKDLSTSNEVWMMATTSGYLLGPVFCFFIPIGLALFPKRDHKYFSLGLLAGIMAIPFGIFVTTTLLKIFNPKLRPEISTSGESTMQLHYTWGTIIMNILPMAILCVLIAIGLYLKPEWVTKIFLWFANILNIILKVAFVLSIINYYTGIFTNIFGDAWKLQPILADEADQFRGAELCFAVGLMLCGAYPMIHCIQKAFAKPLEKIGAKIGFSRTGATALVGTLCNAMVFVRLFPDMRPKDKVRGLAFAISCSYVLADALSFTMNFQPNFFIFITLGKIAGGIIAILIADLLVKKTVEKYEKEDRQTGIIQANEYIED
jgi:ethanolamine transporter